MKANSKNCAGAKLNADIVGKPAAWIAEQAGFSVPEGTNILAAECKEVGEKEPLTREKLSPVIAVLKSESREDGINKARQMVEFNGLGHSAAIHTADEELTKEFGKAVKEVCSAGCIGCKMCTRVCEADAITVENNIAKIDYSKCTGCGKCAEKCPAKIIL